MSKQISTQEQAYLDGFNAKCAEYGVDPQALMKWAGIGEMLNPANIGENIGIGVSALGRGAKSVFNVATAPGRAVVNAVAPFAKKEYADLTNPTAGKTGKVNTFNPSRGEQNILANYKSNRGSQATSTGKAVEAGNIATELAPNRQAFNFNKPGAPQFLNPDAWLRTQRNATESANSYGNDANVLKSRVSRGENMP